jgi:hypothetical protein
MNNDQYDPIVHGWPPRFGSASQPALTFKNSKSEGCRAAVPVGRAWQLQRMAMSPREAALPENTQTEPSQQMKKPGAAPGF